MPKGKCDDNEDALSATRTGLHLKVGFRINTLTLLRSQAVRQLLATPFELEAWLTAYSLLRQQAHTVARVFYCHALARRDWNTTAGAGTANQSEKELWDDNEDDNFSR